MWSGRQNADADACGNTDRRVVYYPMEYMGGGGANYVRDNSGNWVKEFRITDYLGSVRTAIQSTAGATLNYTPYGKPSNTTDRWSYLGQEKDRETFGLSEFDYRKYQSETGSFLRPDPLWASSPKMSSFVYGGASPLVFTDPSGLVGEVALDDPAFPCDGIEVWASRDMNDDRTWWRRIRSNGGGLGGFSRGGNKATVGKGSGGGSSGGSGSGGFRPINASEYQMNLLVNTINQLVPGNLGQSDADRQLANAQGFSDAAPKVFIGLFARCLMLFQQP